MEKSFINALENIVGKERAISTPEDLACYSFDLFARAVPEVVVLPATTDEVSCILDLANRHKIAVTPRGSGTSLTGGPVPVNGGIVMAMTRMNQILEISEEDRLVVVQPGVVTGDLQRAVLKHGLFYPPNPTSADYCTIGGNVATNAGGASGVKYGVTRDYILEMTAVLADGSIIKTGNRCIKSVTGFDFKSAFCGSEGLLCIITEVTLRLVPAPEAVKTSLAYFDSVTKAADAVSEIIKKGFVPSTMELMDDGFLQAVSTVYGLKFPEAAGAALLIEFDGDSAAIDKLQNRVKDICMDRNCLEFTLAENPKEQEALWKARKGGTAALVRNETFMQTLDFCVPLSCLGKGVTGLQKIAKEHALKMVLIGHAGDGNLHPMFIYDPSDPLQKEAFSSAEEKMCSFILSINGTLSGEHGIGMEKSAFLDKELSSTVIKLSRTLKDALDPNHILNPGKCGF